jgi:RNA polymerase sigma-70 factor, ECF subfamily
MGFRLDIVTSASGLPLRTRFRAQDPDIVERRLEALVAEARSAWPTVRLDEETFLRHLGERLPPEGGPDDVLDAVKAGDLYLACACLRAEEGDEAIRLLEGLVSSALDIGLRGIADDTLAQEAKQLLLEHLLVGDRKIRDYAGRGHLASWLKMSGIRIVHKLRRKTHREVPLGDDALADHFLPADDPELEQLKAVYRDHFRDAFRAAVRGLTLEDRGLLKQHLLDGLGSAELAVLRGVHRATVSRWIVRAQQQLAADTRRALMARLGIDRAELESVMRLIESRLDASLHRLDSN